MRKAQDILHKALQRWRWIRISEMLIGSFAMGVSAFLIFHNTWVALVAFLAALLSAFLYIKPWKYTIGQVCSHLDETIAPMEHSTGLLLEHEGQLPILSRIQRARSGETLRRHQGEIRFKHAIWPILGLSLILILGAWLLNVSGILKFDQTPTEVPKDDVVNFQVLDSVKQDLVPPKIIEQEIRVQYPTYTQKSMDYLTQMNLGVLEGSRVTWDIQFDQPLKGVQLQIGEDSLQMNASENSYLKTLAVDYANFYALKFEDSLGHSYLSDLYALEIYKDESPIIEMGGLQQFSTFEFEGPQKLTFSANLKDDFGLTDVAIVATVSKGSGESVKFREERLGFDSKLVMGTKSQNFSKTLNLRELKMEPGDELYFYVEAVDNKQPRPNISRTETFFSVIKDTVTNQFAVEGTLGADLMPDYFRSQRQLIIDTEKLIADKPSIEKKQFNFRSNELGFDQKALRIKYGEFMGDESEGAPVVTEVQEEVDSGNPLAEYTHDHDGSNENNLVSEEHGDHGNEESEEDPLEAYVHNHEDPEASTLFAQSLKSKLKQAMAEMWDAELYLRLFQPEKSLPYQYKALKLIQEIKNSARIYVHRIGFDPPPIKEDKRLTGELKEIGNYSKNETSEREKQFPNMRKAVARLEILLHSQLNIRQEDRKLFDKAGSELAKLAIDQPGKYLETLQTVKWLSQAETVNKEQLELAVKGLYEALPQQQDLPSAELRYNNQLNHLFIEALDVE